MGRSQIPLVSDTPRWMLLRDQKPVVEHVVTDQAESFLWRLDDYPWERNVWNVHPEYEIHLVRNASGIALVGDHIERFEPGYLAIVGSYLPHDWVTPTLPGELIEGRDIVLQFDPDRVRRAAVLLPECAELGPFLALARRGLAFHGEARRSGAQDLELMGSMRGLERLALFLRLLHRMAVSDEYRVLSSPGFAPNLDGQAQDAIQQALAYLLKNFTGDVRLPDLSRLLGMSDWAFSRFFRKNTGNTFTDYVATLRTGLACKLLAETNLPVTSICFEVGYTNVSNFNRIFRTHRGMTPSAYRRLAGQRMTKRRDPANEGLPQSSMQESIGSSLGRG